MDGVGALELAHSAEAAHLDERHRIAGMEDHGLRVAIGGRNVGEPLHIAAEPVVGVLHHQRVDLALGHLVTRRAPSPFKFPVRNGRGDAFRRNAHDFAFFAGCLSVLDDITHLRRPTSKK